MTASTPPDPEPAGFGVPPHFGAPVPPPVGGGDDPLVPPPDGGLNVFIEYLVATVRRSGRVVAQILLLTFALPQIGLAMVVESMAGGVLVATGGVALPAAGTNESATPEDIFAGFTGETVLIMVVGLLATSLLASIGWAATIWAITERAVGLPVTVGGALRAGLGRAAPMFGWYLLYVLLVTVGLLLCILPGLYLGLAASLFSFAVIYERGQNPVGRSFAVVHQAFGVVLGRISLLVVSFLAFSCVLSSLLLLLGLGDSAETGAGRLTGAAVDAVITIPLYLVLVVGLLLTYTQARARREALATTDLWRAANAPA